MIPVSPGFDTDMNAFQVHWDVCVQFVCPVHYWCPDIISYERKAGRIVRYCFYLHYHLYLNHSMPRFHTKGMHVIKALTKSLPYSVL